MSVSGDKRPTKKDLDRRSVRFVFAQLWRHEETREHASARLEGMTIYCKGTV